MVESDSPLFHTARELHRTYLFKSIKVPMSSGNAKSPLNVINKLLLDIEFNRVPRAQWMKRPFAWVYPGRNRVELIGSCKLGREIDS